MDSRFEFDAPKYYGFQTLLSSSSSPGHTADAWFATQGPSGTTELWLLQQVAPTAAKSFRRESSGNSALLRSTVTCLSALVDEQFCAPHLPEQGVGPKGVQYTFSSLLDAVVADQD